MSLDDEKLTNNELVALFLKMDLHMVAQVAETLSPERAAHVVAALEAEAASCDATSQRICALFLGLSSKEQVVAVGRVMNTKFTMLLIQELIQRDQRHLWKISSLLIGLTQRVFKKVLTNASDDQLEVLQHEAMKEPLQHHLTVYAHEAGQELNQIIDELLQIEKEIAAYDLATLTRSELHAQLRQIESYHERIDTFLTKIARALGIAWNTNRPDLIDQLNKIQDTCRRTLEMTLGTPRGKETEPTGLYRILEERVCCAFRGEKEAEQLKDEEPNVEALAAMDLWTLKDYWEMGLLPSIANESDLKLNPDSHSDKECQNYRENLMDEVKENLDALGLSSVRDFKRAYIGTAKLLHDYIESRSASFTSDTTS